MGEMGELKCGFNGIKRATIFFHGLVGFLQLLLCPPIRLTCTSETLNSGQENKPISDVEGATVDVDKIWEQMNSNAQSAVAQSQPEAGTSLSKPSEKAGDPHTSGLQGDDTDTRTETGHAINTASTGEEMITIKRTYAFAGEKITEEKLVSKSSAEARLHLHSQQTDPDHISKPGMQPPLRRPKKRSSMFEPSSEGLGQMSNASKGKGPKLNTIEKSKLDWAGYVDQEGMKDELDGAEKSKDGYLGKKDFLDRVVAKRDHEILSAKKR